MAAHARRRAAPDLRTDTAHAFQISEEAGAFAGLNMAMNGIPSAFVLPIGLRVLLE
nr:LrgB family protein [Caballeronia sp. dw_19]